MSTLVPPRPPPSSPASARPPDSPRAGGPLGTLPADLTPLLEGGAIMHLATRNAKLEPASVLAYGVRTNAPAAASTPDRLVSDAGHEVTVFVPAALAATTMANLRDNGQMALTIVRPTDNRAIQMKGLWLGERRTDDDDHAFLSRYRDALTDALGMVGVPRSVWRRVTWWPSLALRLEVRDVFVQTPGPGAGRRCAADQSGAP